MKNQSEQPKHTQGELENPNSFHQMHEEHFQVFVRITEPNGEKYTVGCAYGRTKEEAEANAQRIVKAVNMHDELIEKLKLMTSLCRLKYGNLDKEVYDEIEKSELLLKKAEQNQL